MEGTSWRGRKRRREGEEVRIREDDDVEEVPSARELVRERKERRESMGDAERLVHDAMQEVRAREIEKEKISAGMEEAIGELREMESRKETTESKIKKALGELEDPVNDTEPQLRTEKASNSDSLDDWEIDIRPIDDVEVREKEQLNEVPQERENRFRVESDLDSDKLNELDSQIQDGNIRYGKIENKVYIWTPDDTPTKLENTYSDFYYYFRDKESFDQYLHDVGDSLEIPTQNRNETEKALHELASQMLTEPIDDNCINTRTKRIRGDYVRLMNDISGKTLKDIEGDISRVTGQNGQGGIENPRFPHGEKREVAVARMAGTVMSDCTIEPNGVIKYAESEMSRIRIVVENLNEFGDINPPSTYIESENHYITHIPFVMGKMMIQRGVPSGDRTIQNPRLISSVREGSDRVQRAYTEDFITQDGCVGDKSVIWRRANALDAGKKSEKYNFEPKVGVKEIDLIEDEGRKEKGNATGWTLSWGKLNDLVETSDNRISKTADKLQRIVMDNPNKLIHDEADVVRELGANIEVKPSEIKYYPETGRVTTIWQARTTGLKEAIKVGATAPPNDTIKKEKMERMIKGNPTKTREALEELRRRDIDFERWWE